MPLLCLCRWYANEAIRFCSAHVVLLHQGKKIKHWSAPHVALAVCCVCLCCTYPAMCAVLLWSAFRKEKIGLCEHAGSCCGGECLGLCLSSFVLNTRSGFFFEPFGLNLIADNVDVWERWPKCACTIIKQYLWSIKSWYQIVRLFKKNEIFPDLNLYIQHKYNFTLYFLLRQHFIFTPPSPH